MRRIGNIRNMSRALSNLNNSNITAVNKELLYGARNYEPIMVNICHAKGIYMFDDKNKRYYDYLAGYSSVNQGHCNTRIVKAAINQMQRLTLTSRAFTNDKLGAYFEFMTKTFKYDSILPTNTGVEAGETAVKLARLWGYKHKNVPENEAVVCFATNNFWGRSIAAISSSNDPKCYKNFGPYTPGLQLIKYNDIDALKTAFEENSNIVAYMAEPIQGEAGIIIPDEGYLKKVRKLCDDYNVLFIADEIQTGLGRTGKLMACDYDKIKPDMLLLGKALSGGLMPISCVLADHHVMKHMGINMHGSTYGGNPLSAVIAETAVRYTIDRKLPANSFILGVHFRDELQRIQHKYSYIKDIRGKGLMNAIQCADAKTASTLVTRLRENNILTKTTHETTLRMTPPLIITERQLNESLEHIEKAMGEV